MATAPSLKVTEDYSSYESVDEEEPEAPIPAKAKKGAKKTDTQIKDTQKPKDQPTIPPDDDSKVEAKNPIKKITNVSKRPTTKPDVSRKPSLGGSNSLKSYFSAGGTKR